MTHWPELFAPLAEHAPHERRARPARRRASASPQAIHAAVELGVPDLLADGERTSDDLAEASGADPSTLYRLLRALASLGVLHEAEGRRFSLTPLGQPLRSDVPGSLRGWARLVGREYVWRSWGNLAERGAQRGELVPRALRRRRVRVARRAPGGERDLRRGDEVAHGALDRRGPRRVRLRPVRDDRRRRRRQRHAARVAARSASGSARDPLRSGACRRRRRPGPARQREWPTAARSSPGASSRTSPTGGDAYVLKSIIHDWEDEESVAILERMPRIDGAGRRRAPDRARSRSGRTRTRLRSSRT